MNMSLTPTPTHDRRRGSSSYKSAPGYAEADAIPDRHERALALDAVRHAAVRADMPETVPDSHKAAAILADALALALADPEIKDIIAKRVGHHIRRATVARKLDPRHPMTKKALFQRLLPNPRILEVEAQERIAAEIAEAKRRRGTVEESILDVYAMLRDDDETAD